MLRLKYYAHWSQRETYLKTISEKILKTSITEIN